MLSCRAGCPPEAGYQCLCSCNNVQLLTLSALQNSLHDYDCSAHHTQALGVPVCIIVDDVLLDTSLAQEGLHIGPAGVFLAHQQQYTFQDIPDSVRSHTQTTHL